MQISNKSNSRNYSQGKFTIQFTVWFLWYKLTIQFTVWIIHDADLQYDLQYELFMMQIYYAN